MPDSGSGSLRGGPHRRRGPGGRGPGRRGRGQRRPYYGRGGRRKQGLGLLSRYYGGVGLCK